ncbi:MAG: type II secretion system F family protein [Candidatus Omnitrophota bacterium]
MSEPVAGSPPPSPVTPSKLPDPEVLFNCSVRLRDAPTQIKVLTLEATTRDAAIQKLLAQGYMVIDVQEHGKKRGLGGLFSNKTSLSEKSGDRAVPAFLEGVSSRETIFLGIQLATLLKSGIPLVRSLDIIQRGLGNKYFQKVLRHVRKRITEGSTLSHALRYYPKVFTWIWVNLVEVGEATGKLPECLEEIAHYQEATARLKSKVITAFFYPGILTVAVVSALSFLLLFIVPKFAAIFVAQKLALPVLTQIVIAASNVLRYHFLWLAGSITATTIVLIYMGRVPSIKMAYDKIALEMPVFGKMSIEVAVTRFSRSMGTLLRAGVQILQALEIAGRLLNNVYLEEGIKRVVTQVRSGQGLGVQLEARKIFPVFMTQLISVGEESGQLDRFLDLLSNFYEEQVDAFLARLTTLLEPLLLVFMGGVIGVIVVSMFLPIVELSMHAGT